MMNLDIRTLLVSWLLLLPMGLQAQRTSMIAEPFPFFYQLYSNEIYDIYQDRDGYVWLGTTHGLARYDGHQLYTFKQDFEHPTVIGENQIVYMTDNARYLWIGTGRGVTLYDKRSWKMTQLTDSRIKGKRFHDIKTDMQDGVWMAVEDKIIHCGPTGAVIREYAMPVEHNVELEFHQLYIDRHNNIWGLSTHGLFGYDRRHDRFVKYPPLGHDDSPYTMLEDSDGNYWIGTWGDGLWHFYPERTGTACYERQKVMVSGTQQEDKVFYSMVQDDAMGYLWMLSYNELHAMKPVGGGLQPVDISHLLDPHKMFTKLMKDREGNLWLGSYDMGYNIFFDHSGIHNFSITQLKSRLGWDANLLNLYHDQDGVLWMTQDRYGLLLYNPATGMFADCHAPLGEINILKPSNRNGGVWVNSRTEVRILRMTRQGMALQVEEDIRLNNYIANPGAVIDYDEDTAGNLWILTTNNIYIKRPHTAGLVTLGAGQPLISALAVDNSGGAWGVAGRKLYRMTCSSTSARCVLQGDIQPLLGNETTECLEMDANGQLWLGTSLGRIVRSDTRRRQFVSLQLEGIMSDGAILDIVSDHHYAWVVTNKKVIQCRPDGSIVNTFAANQGNILVKAFRHKAICTDGQGGLFVGGHNGLVHLSSQLNLPRMPFRPVVSDITVNGRSICLNVGNDSDKTRQVTLSPDAHNIEISFSTLLYSPAAESQLSYRLKGLDEGWMMPGEGSFKAFYNSLPKGTYRFQMRRRLPDGSWSRGYDVLTIVRQPAFYESTAAYICYALSVLLLLWLLRRYWRRIVQLKDQLVALRGMYLGKTHVSFVKASANIDDDSSEGQLMADITQCIDRHLSDSAFGLEQLADELSISKSTLHRRIKRTFHITPLELIRRIKLKHACIMLESGSKNISEIAYELGFSNPKYFSRCFREEFHITPSQYQQKHHRE
ncbi:MAG: helix-turn-helix domain-containing protein [Prevotella sp.]|nr:helix-turn-helix domain-containing protein [Prevotella sp.]